MCVALRVLMVKRVCIDKHTVQVEALRALETAVAALCECEQYLELAQCLNDMVACADHRGTRLFTVDIASARRQKAATTLAKRKYKAAIESWQVAHRHLPLLPTWPTEQPKGVHDVSAVRLVLRGHAAVALQVQML